MLVQKLFTLHFCKNSVVKTVFKPQDLGTTEEIEESRTSDALIIKYIVGETGVYWNRGK